MNLPDELVNQLLDSTLGRSVRQGQHEHVTEEQLRDSKILHSSVSQRWYSIRTERTRFVTLKSLFQIEALGSMLKVDSRGILVKELVISIVTRGGEETGAIIELLKLCPELIRLEIRCGEWSDLNVAIFPQHSEIWKTLAKMKNLEILKCKSLTGKSFMHLLPHLPKLRDLDFSTPFLSAEDSKDFSPISSHLSRLEYQSDTGAQYLNILKKLTLQNDGIASPLQHLSLAFHLSKNNSALEFALTVVPLVTQLQSLSLINYSPFGFDLSGTLSKATAIKKLRIGSFGYTHLDFLDQLESLEEITFISTLMSEFIFPLDEFAPMVREHKFSRPLSIKVAFERNFNLSESDWKAHYVFNLGIEGVKIELVYPE